MYIYGGISLYMPKYIEKLSPVSMQCTMDWETGTSYANSNDHTNEHNNSHVE